MIVLDTNVLSELTRRRPDPCVLAWLDALRAADVVTTAVTAAELLYGVARLPDGNRKAELSQAIRQIVNDDFRERIEPFDADAAAHYAAVVSGRERLGHPIGIADAQIAAICRRRRAPLATRSTKVFEDTGIELINPWQAP